MARRYEMVAATDVGTARRNNEDSVKIVPRLNLAVLSDGMGGHNAGEVASAMAVGEVCDYFEEQDLAGAHAETNLMPTAFTRANNAVHTNATRMHDCEGMGATLIAASFQDGLAHVGHIGDSRLYRFADGQLSQLTNDHTLAAELAEDEKQGAPEFAEHILRRAIGIEAVCHPDFLTAKTRAGEIYLLCSDGLNAVLDSDDITAILSLRSNTPENCIDTLLNAVLAHGAPDNVSAILVFVR